LDDFGGLAWKLQVTRISVFVGPMTVIRKQFHFKSAAAVLLMMAGIAAVSIAQQAGNAPPKELLQYIQDAKRSGIKDDKIRQQAMLVGWPAGMVDQAMAFDKSGKALPQASEAAETPAAAKSQPPEGDVVVAAPAEPAVGAPAGGTRTIGANRNPEVPQDYQIAAGDTLQVSVWKEQEVSVPSEIVRPDGKISVPLIKDIEVAGLTTRQVEKVVTEQLTKFYTDANVTVVVIAMAPKKVYVTGGVKKEGPVPFVYGMTVMQAISEAGGLTDYARRRKIYILRTENGREYRLDFNYEEVVKGVRMEQNILLVPSDTVVIPN
jgi:polysaccharide biosynthesis/export protein